MAVVGQAEIRIRPLVGGFAADLERQLAPQIARVEARLASRFGGAAFATAGQEAGVRFVDQFGNALIRDAAVVAKPALQRVEKAIAPQAQEVGERVGRQLAQGFQEGFAALAAFAIAARIGRFLRQTVGAAIEFETAFAGVRKVIQGTPEEMAELQRSILGLSESLPFAASEIARVAQTAGQLGVRTADIGDFTTTMLQLGVSTNLSADQAANALARFSAAFGFPLDRVDRLGSAIVELGNRIGVTEGEIAEFAQLLAGQARVFGLTADQTFAIAAAARRAGLETEAGATAINRSLALMQSAARSGGPQLTRFASVLGIATEEFRRLALEDPAQVFLQFLGALRAQGGRAVEVLKGLELGEIRVTRNLTQFAGATDVLARSLSLSEEAFRQNTALVREYGVFADTAASKVQLLQNAFTNTRIEIGAKLAPVLVSTLGPFARLRTETVSLGTAFLGLTAAAFTVQRFGRILNEVTVALDRFTVFGLRAGGVLKGLGIAAAAALAIDILGQAFQGLQTQIDTFTRGAQDIERTEEAFLGFARGVESASQAIEAARLGEGLAARFDLLNLGLEQILNTISGGSDIISRNLRGALEPIPLIGGIVETNVERITRTFADFDQALSQIARTAGPDVAQAVFRGLREQLLQAGFSVNDINVGTEGFAKTLAALRNEALGALADSNDLAAGFRSLGLSAEDAAEAALALGASLEAGRGALAFLDRVSSSFDSRLDSLIPSFAELDREQTRSARSAGRLAGAQEKAADRIRDAEKALARAREEAAESVADAERRLAEAEEDAIQRVIDAQRRLQDVRLGTRRRFRDAQQALIDFQNALARAGGARTPEDLLRLRDLEQGVRDAREDARSADEDARDDIQRAQEEGVEAVEEARRRLVEAEEDAAQRIADALERLAEAHEQSARRSSAAASSVADNTIRTVAQLEDVFRQSASRLDAFADLIDRLAPRIVGAFGEDLGETFLARLVELGPAAVPLLRNLVRLSDTQLAGLAKAFERQIKQAKRVADFQFDRFPENFAAKIRAATEAATRELDDLISQFDRIEDKTGEVALVAQEDLDIFARQLQKLDEAALIHLTPVERGLLETGINAQTATERVDALRELVSRLKDRTVNIRADTSEAEEAIARIGESIARAFREFGIDISASIRERGAAHGARLSAGQRAVIEPGLLELVRGPATVTGPGEVISAARTSRILQTLSSLQTSGGVIQHIQVNEVAQDPLATARAVASIIGRKSIR